MTIEPHQPSPHRKDTTARMIAGSRDCARMIPTDVQTKPEEK